jgi:hypothetical protein
MLNERINGLKVTFHALWERMTNTYETSDNDSIEVDNLPLKNAKEEEPGVSYTTTENNPLAAGTEKVDAIGIDSFGEDDSVDPKQIN